MFSQTTEYALRLVVYLASLDGKPATIPQIARATKTPPDYLAKVLRNLARARLVRSQRGLRGGSVLARLADQITVLDVVQAVEPIRRIKTCPLGIKRHGPSLCPLHRRLDQAISLVEAALRGSTIADLVDTAADDAPLCETPGRGRKLPVLR